MFLVELAYGTVVTVKNAPQEMLAPLILVETPRIVFPFARAIIANATRDGGFPPLMINPIDFAELLRRQQEDASRRCRRNRRGVGRQASVQPDRIRERSAASPGGRSALPRRAHAAAGLARSARRRSRARAGRTKSRPGCRPPSSSR